MINTQTVKQNVDLLALVGRDSQLKRVSSTQGGEYAGPCPFCGGRDRFRVQPNHESGGRWFCRSCGGGRWHDAIDYVQRRDNVDFRAAVQVLGGDYGQLPEAAATPATKPATIEQPPAADWQAAVMPVIQDCAARLFSGGRDVLTVWQYLTGRGLTRETVFNASLGFNPTWREVMPGAGAWLAPGIVIPCLAGADIWYLQVRTTKAAREEAKRRGRNLGKYQALTGSHLKAVYGANGLGAADLGIVVEGELDALLLGQEAAGLGVAVVTMGSANSWPGAAWRRYFAHLSGLFVVMDNDQAGAAGLRRWGELVPWARPVIVGEAGQDITDFYQTGGDLRGWVSDLLA